MVAPKAQPPLLALVDELLAEQGRLQTPVVRAAEAFDRNHSGRFNSRKHADLIPLSAPAPGEQYAFEVDLDACAGCKSCVVACHALNGLDEHESWRDVGFITGGSHAAPYQQTVTTACHHCADPGCLNGCPVLAYEKDSITGIVRHLDDQCIGCQYCVLKCPYDVPKYNARLGIVRKCDMCHQRLAAGEAPACVQSCPTHAIKIVNVTVGKSTRRADTSLFLSSAPSPDYTQPTSRYVTKRRMPADAQPADREVLRPQPPHWPLILMLVCTQAALGLHTASLFVTHYITNRPAPLLGKATYYVTFAANPLGWAALVFAAAGLAASVAHLGRPLRAWRIFLGWRRSWLSREAIVFGAWFPALAASVATDLFAPFADALAVGLGLVGVSCSAMIYIDTRRVAWRAAQTLPRFLGTAAVCGATGFALLRPSDAAILGFAFTLTLKLGFELRAARPAGEHDRETRLLPALATARLLTGGFHRIWSLRLTGAMTAGLLVTYYVTNSGGNSPEESVTYYVTNFGDGSLEGSVTYYVTVGLLAGLAPAGELAERYLYFRTVDAPKLPGGAG